MRALRVKPEWLQATDALILILLFPSPPGLSLFYSKTKQKSQTSISDNRADITHKL